MGRRIVNTVAEVRLATGSLLPKLGERELDGVEGTLLDHSVLLMGGSQVNSHSGGSFPTLLAGGRKLGFRHGQHVKWKGGTTPMSNLYLTILQQLGCPVESFTSIRRA